MIDIIYDKMNEDSFILQYNKSIYIPGSFYIKFPNYPELAFFKAIMEKHPKIQFESEEESGYTIYYNYKIDKKGFSIVYDKDYDLISFETDAKSRKAIAEYLAQIIERHHSKSHYDI
ncbi:MAG TPA: hypothetical protein PLQ04_06735 [Lachnospiraceae bacterium]|nr:hypothetical protein [Lachnospiraceae bacterium]